MATEFEYSGDLTVVATALKLLMIFLRSQNEVYFGLTTISRTSPLSVLMKKDSTHMKGTDARRGNMKAAQVVAEIVKSSLGPRGMDKMVIDAFKDGVDVLVTRDGGSMLNRMDVKHPGAKIMLDLSKTIDHDIGDGTISAVTIAGELLRRAEALLDMNIHANVVADGYFEAAERTLEFLNDIAVVVSPTDRLVLRDVAKTAIGSKTTYECDFLAELCVKAILMAMNKVEEKYTIDLDDVNVWKQPGGSILDTILTDGIILDKQPVHPEMPRKIEGAKIALLDCALELAMQKTRFEARIQIESPDKMQEFINEERNMLRNSIDKLASLGVKVAVFKGGIDEIAQSFLARSGILAMRRARDLEMNALAKATGARVISYLDDLREKDLGWANVVEERKIGNMKWTFIEDCKNPKAVTIMIRGGTGKVTEEEERTLKAGLSALREVVSNPKVVAGGGASEVEVAKRIRHWARVLPNRKQLAAIEFAEALESIPIALAKNAGLNPIDTIMRLRSAHYGDKLWIGIDSIGCKIADMWKQGTREPLSVKEQIVKSASETAAFILRIDDVIANPSERSKGT